MQKLPFALCLLALAASCRPSEDASPYYGTTERHGKDIHTFYVNNLGEPEYVDPGKVHDTTSSKLVLHLFEGLMAYGPDAEPTLGAANKYDKTSDSRFFRFYIRDDAKWSDGKPVSAHDFEYSFKRVIDPATISQSASNLYVLKNAELVNQGKLKVTKAETSVFDGPTTSSKAVVKLPSGAAVRVLARSPVVIDSAIAPFPEVPKGVEALGYDKADEKAKTPEKLVLLFEKTKETKSPDDVQRLPKGDYDVIRRLDPVVCNGDPDYYFELTAKDGSGKRGVLPGCMLGESSAKDAMVLVSRHDDIPTFAARKLPEEQPQPVPLGFVPEASIKSDTSVIGVRAVSDSVLELELAYPAPYLLDILCNPTSFPVRKDVVEKFTDDPDRWTRAENIVSNGPYKIDKWRFRYEIRMTRNQHHRFYDKLKIHEIVWMSVESTVSAMNLYKAGELDYSGDNSSPPPTYIPFLQSKKDFERNDYIGTYWYEYNTKSPPLDKVEVRQALNYALDKQEIVDRVVLGKQLPAPSFVPPFMGGGYSEAVKAEKDAGKDPFAGDGFNPERARELLGKAGFPVVKDGDGWRAEGMPPIELLYNTLEGNRKLAVAIQDMWKRHLGVSVSLRNEEWKVMLKSVRDRNFQIVRFGWIGDYDHPQTFMDTFMSDSPNNRTGWKSPQFDAIVTKARQTGDVAESMKLYRQAERILVDELPKLPIYFYTKSTLIKPYVKGHHFNRRNEQMIHWMWIDENWRNNPSDEPSMTPELPPAPGEY